MAEIINIDEAKNQEVTLDQLKEITKIFDENVDDNDLTEGPLKQLLTLLSMEEETFKILAPGVLQNFKQTINNPNEKLALVQSLNASGGKAEDLIEMFTSLYDEVEKTDGLPRSKKDFIIEIIASLINSIQDTEGISKRIVQIPIQKCNPEAIIPQYAHIDDSGMDLYALDDYTIAPGETKLIPTGLKIGLPPGFELQVRPKSGRALNTKLRVANTPGTIDAGYRDEICVIIENIDPPIRAIHLDYSKEILPETPIPFGAIEFGQSYTIGKGEKFAQLVLSEVPKAAFFEVEAVGEIGENRGGGFGSTGLT